MTLRLLVGSDGEPCIRNEHIQPLKLLRSVTKLFDAFERAEVHLPHFYNSFLPSRCLNIGLRRLAFLTIATAKDHLSSAKIDTVTRCF